MKMHLSVLISDKVEITDWKEESYDARNTKFKAQIARFSERPYPRKRQSIFDRKFDSFFPVKKVQGLNISEEEQKNVASILTLKCVR